MRKLGLVLLVLGILFVPVLVVAQTVTGTMQGTVTDRSGAALPGVTITIRNLETGQERVVVTNSSGFFSAPFLPVGKYRAQAELSGFGTVVRPSVRVELNQTTVPDFVLNPSISETVTVSGEVPRINVTDGEIKQTMTSKEIMDRPNIAGNSFLSLAETLTGFQENPTSGQNNPFNSSGSSINFNGTGTRGATFQVNGVNNDDSSENQNRQGVPLATIQSFQVITNNFSAEFGRGYGSVILVQTKSGTNKFSGELYDYSQKGRWNDKSFFSKLSPKPDNHRDEYGITGGFPIVRDRLFGYIALDKVDNAGLRNYAKDIFLPNEFTAPRLTLKNDTPENRAFIESVLARFPHVVPNDPRSNRTYATLQQTSFPDKDYSARLDLIAGLAQSLTGRYQQTHQIRIPQDVIIGENVYQDNRQSNFGLTWTSVLSNNTVQEGRYGLGLRSTNGNIGSGNDTPIIRFSGTPFSGSIIGSSTNFPINRHQRDQQLVYNLSSVLFKKHTLKVGTDLRRSTLNDHAENANRGFYTFAKACGGVTYATPYDAFLAGCVNTFTKSYGPAETENLLKEENFYADDAYRVRDNLTFDLGARYEIVSPPSERKNRVDYQYGTTHYVDPRVSFAYQPEWTRGGHLMNWFTGGEGRMSIRGGFGIFHGRIFQSIFSQNGANIRFNPPNGVSLSFLNQTNLADPTNGFVFTPGPQTARFGTVVKVDPNLKMPDTRQWNLTVERQLGSRSRMRLSYVGTYGKGLLQYRFDNLPVSPLAGGIVVPDHPFNAPLPGRPDLRGKKIDKIAANWRCAGTGFFGLAFTAACPVAVPIADNEVSLRVPRINERRPNPLYGNILTVNNGADTWYHAAQLELESGQIHGFNGRVSYTFSKAIDTGSEATGLDVGDTNILGPHYEFARGLSRFDTRHRFTFSGSYLLPFFRNSNGLAGAVLSGWQLSAIVKITSGTPFTVIDSSADDIDFDGFAERRPILVDKSRDGHHITDPNTSTTELPASAFRRATPDDRISDLVGRNNFFTAGLRNIDMGLYKSFPAAFHDTVMLRLEVYNILNHVQWGFPQNDIASPTFGQILRTGNNYSPRTYQVGVRYMY